MKVRGGVGGVGRGMLPGGFERGQARTEYWFHTRSEKSRYLSYQARMNGASRLQIINAFPSPMLPEMPSCASVRSCLKGGRGVRAEGEVECNLRWVSND